MYLQPLFRFAPFYLPYLITTFLPQALSQAPQNAILNPGTDAFINQLLADWRSPGGVGVAVVRKGDGGVWNVETKGYGIATIDGSKVTENTLFGLGSNSKIFNAFALGLLVHNETLSPRLTWTTKIASVIPGWDLLDSDAAQRATIVDLMSHRTGLPRHDFSYTLSDNISSIVGKVKTHRASAEFRDVYQYNNIMYAILTYLPSLVLPSKTPFTRHVRQHILDPLGMTATTYSYDAAKEGGQLADGVVRQRISAPQNASNGTARVLPYWSQTGGEDGNILSGLGGVISNSVDMATWLQMLLLDGVNPSTNTSLIPLDVIQRTASGISIGSSTARFPELSPIVYGAGQQRGSYRGHEFIEHGGSVPAFNSVITRLPLDGLGIAVLSNDFDYGNQITEIIKYRILDEALGLDKVDWNSRYKARASSPPTVTPRPANPSFPSSNLTTLAGIYNNSGYEKFELCLISPQDPAASPSCKALAANISTILPGAVSPNLPTFIGKWDSPWFSHIRMTHFDGNIFNIGLSSVPTNNVSEPYFTYDLSGSINYRIYAEAAFDGSRVGIGMTGIWAAGAGIPSPSGQTVRERAEAFFEKI